MKNFIIFIFATAFVVFLFTSCKKDNGPDPNEGTAHLNLYLTDDPAVYDKVNIDIQSVEINSEGEGWHTYTLLHPGIYDLLKFNNGVDTLMISEDVSPRTISQIRLILGPNNSVVVDGVSHAFEVPSGEESGLKLNVHYTFEAGIIYDLWMDFDAEASIVEKGNGDYSLKPVIHIYTQELSGSISGLINPVTAAFSVEAITPTDTFNTSISDDGSFLIGGLPSGTYDVHFSAVAGFVDVTVPDVNVNVGTVTDIGTVIIPL